MPQVKILRVDEDKCVNCHQCIAVCSTKFANDGSGDTVNVNDDLCIGCGECIKACTHNARIPVDDFDSAFKALQKDEKIIAVVAPAVASTFPEKYMNFNGWLKSLGIDAIFDVSFGAELTIRSYLNYIQGNNDIKTVIAQPCPAIVSYIEIYLPELIPHLAPADSPMLHTVRMVKEYYKQYSKHKILMVSPCLAKKREFDETGLVDYNVTLRSFEEYIEKQKIKLGDYPETEFDNDSAERAVLFSTPGGLLQTAEREVPEIRNRTRKIEGPQSIYPYLDHLRKQIDKNYAPLLIDCLNCEKGCNGGTGTTKKGTSEDELEFLINQRKIFLQKRYNTDKEDKVSIEQLNKIIDKFWKEGLYTRTYVNRHELYSEQIKKPSKEELKKTYELMHKYSDEDIINCSSCGYNSCEMMAEVIYNGLNRPKNCHFFLSYENDEKSQELTAKNKRIMEQKKNLINQSENLLEFLEKIKDVVNS